MTLGGLVRPLPWIGGICARILPLDRIGIGGVGWGLHAPDGPGRRRRGHRLIVWRVLRRVVSGLLSTSLRASKKRKREKARRGSMKRVRFAADVVDHGPARPAPEVEEAVASGPGPSCRGAAMPANREALYRGMLRGRSMLRTACSY
ncbi:hypothetical protein TRIUR3_34569 [Triticum urartu]|uniref:Uncharacterized protein n=1 Tax=Triticum urartu TaxID=4572 RepID=M7ZFX6_TRIUA|nr:hypothetical protein TRIUR3_34569 [Triticum urartu]